jgi:branched-chain amino acid transport system permease protein
MTLAALPKARRVEWTAMLKDAALAALVALVLAVPLAGLQAVESNAALTIRTRFSWVVLAVAIVFAGRLLLRLVWAARLEQAGALWRRALAPLHGAGRSRTLAALALALVLVLPFLPFSSTYLVGIATFVMIYVLLGWGLNVVVGLAGLLDLGYVAFYAVGAYSFAILAQRFHLGFWPALPIGALLAATFGILLGFPVLRLRGDYLAIVTLGFGEIIHIILQNWVPVTGGPQGIGPIPPPTLFGLSIERRPPPGVASLYDTLHLAFDPRYRVLLIYYVVLTLALVTNLFTLRLRRLPIGRAWEALREDEFACRALGINPTTIKLSAFAIGAMLAGLAGVLFAAKQNVLISPDSFTFTESATILAIVVLGGAGSQLGVMLAAIVVVTLPELRVLAEFRMLIFGAAMVAVMVWRPRGLIAHREPSLRLGLERCGLA